MTEERRTRSIDVRVWGKVQHVAPGQFVAVASIVPDRPEDADQGADVETSIFGSLEAATAGLHDLVAALGRRAVERGQRVVDVETD